jgi:hypothetical protein
MTTTAGKLAVKTIELFADADTEDFANDGAVPPFLASELLIRDFDHPNIIGVCKVGFVGFEVAPAPTKHRLEKRRLRMERIERIKKMTTKADVAFAVPRLPRTDASLRFVNVCCF